jgi:hypothetical protein
MSPALFDRDGHLSALGLDRLRLESETFTPAELTASRAHLATCAACQNADAEACALDATFALTPPRPRRAPDTLRAEPHPPGGPARPQPSPARRGGLAVVFGALAFAATALLAVPDREASEAPRGANPDTLRPKGGGGLDLSVWIHDGGGATLATAPDFPVRAGDRMGFVVTHATPGYLLILGHDDAGQRYGCFPQSDALPVAAAAVPASPLPTQLPGAMAFDATPGRERIVAVLCGAPFGSGDLPPDPCPHARTGQLVIHGAPCHIRCVTLAKTHATPAARQEAHPP